MRLHVNNLTETDLRESLTAAKKAGYVGLDVTFTVLSEHGSRTHKRAFEVQLGSHGHGTGATLPDGAFNAYGKPQKNRRRANSGNGSWAATWSEWGGLMVEVFRRDPKARWGDLKSWNYNGMADFHEKTRNLFKEW